MKLSKETVKILEQYAVINPSIIIEEGNRLISNSVDRSILSTVLTKEKFEHELCINHLSQFLSILSCFNEPEIIVNEKKITIRENGQTFSYAMSDRGVVESSGQFNKLIPNEPEYEYEFILAAEKLNKLLSMMRVATFDCISFFSREGSIFAKVFNKDNPTLNTFEVQLSEGYEGADFSFMLSKENISMIDKSLSYKASVSSRGLCRLDSLGTENGLTYWIAFVIEG